MKEVEDDVPEDDDAVEDPTEFEELDDDEDEDYDDYNEGNDEVY